MSPRWRVVIVIGDQSFPSAGGSEAKARELYAKMCSEVIKRPIIALQCRDDGRWVDMEWVGARLAGEVG